MTPLDQPSCSFYQVYQICSIAEITNISMSFGVAEICDVTETTPAGWKKGSPIYHSDRFWGGFYIHFNGCFFDCARDFASYRRLMLIEGLSQLKPIDVRYDLDMMFYALPTSTTRDPGHTTHNHTEVQPITSPPTHTHPIPTPNHTQPHANASQHSTAYQLSWCKGTHARVSR